MKRTIPSGSCRDKNDVPFSEPMLTRGFSFSSTRKIRLAIIVSCTTGCLPMPPSMKHPAHVTAPSANHFALLFTSSSRAVGTFRMDAVDGSEREPTRLPACLPVYRLGWKDGSPAQTCASAPKYPRTRAGIDPPDSIIRASEPVFFALHGIFRRGRALYHSVNDGNAPHERIEPEKY